MLLYHHQNVGLIPFENVAQIRYLGLTETNQNLVRRKLIGD
jgi:hypothetical protein